jgi:hypothetical protein
MGPRALPIGMSRSGAGQGRQGVWFQATDRGRPAAPSLAGAGARADATSVDSTWSLLGRREHPHLPTAPVLVSDVDGEFGRTYRLLTTNPAGRRDMPRRTGPFSTSVRPAG